MNKIIRGLLDTPNLTKEEEGKLFKKIESNEDVEDSIDRIYRSYYKYGYIMARKRIPTNFQHFEDVMSDVSVNIVKAIKKFKLGKKSKFSSYCYFWINAAILRSFDKTQLKFSSRDKEVFLKISKFSEKHGDFFDFLDPSFKEEENEHYIQAYQNRVPLSLDILRDGLKGEGQNYGVEPRVSGDQLDSCYQNEIRSMLSDAFKGLSDKEKEVFKLRNGLDDSMQTIYSKKTCKEIGKINDVTKQTVSIWEKKINEKIKNHISFHKLGGFL